ncbi:MAG: hypothetical protein OHM56_06890 [Spiroplasma phoeniceum]|nr:MAG: hypothetical protein OHM57_06295 [Spiroplasma phoeniceum]UZQ31376.1 MAG: hypothetical protein OHM56_06890 [Spiroplasma phoeniceum]
MKIYILKKYQKFINIFFIIFLAYILFSSSFSIIDIAGNYSFLNITLNLFYLIWSSFISLFFMGILVQILINFKQLKKTTISAWKLILFSNWQIIILLLCNIVLISYILFFGYTSIIFQLQNIIAYETIYSFLVILCYVFYAIFTISFIVMPILFRLYIGYLKNINDVIASSYYTFFKCTLTSIVIPKQSQLRMSILLIIYPNYNFNQWFIKKTSIVDNLRKTELLTQFKKQITPPNLYFN